MLRGQEQQLWHTDSSFKTTPALASVLSARIIPENGGETEFASTRLAWDRLPDPQKEELRDLIVVHSYANSRDQIDPKLMTPQERVALPPVRWADDLAKPGEWPRRALCRLPRRGGRGHGRERGQGTTGPRTMPSPRAVHRALVFATGTQQWVLLSISAAGFAFVLYQMIPIWTTEIAVTNHRLVVKRVWLTRSTSELQLKSIEQVNFHQGLLGRLFDFGRIDIHGTGVDDLRLPNIGCPTHLVKAIENASIPLKQPQPPLADNPTA